MSNFLKGLFLVLAATLSAGLHAQELEPNNSCDAAQDLTAVGLPATVFGELVSTPESPDVDFFRFSVPAGQLLLVELEGSSTGQGTLGDPYLGLFDSACNFLAADDDGGGSLNSRLVFEVPPDGLLTLAVTVCCDVDFAGGGQGSYRLSLSTLAAIDSISGRIVNGDTGEGLPGFDFPFAYAQLIRCDVAFGCFETVGSQQADGDGRFSFTTDAFGHPLTTGLYQVSAAAGGFENFQSDRFEVFEGEARDVGDLPLTPFRLIGSVSGRVIDAVSGEPVSGFGPPYAIIYLERCEAGGCYYVAGGNPDFDGRFSFEGVQFFIPPGTFRLRGFAEDYRETVSVEFDVGAFAHVDTGDFPLTPFPIRFGMVQECQIPPGGGLCEYGIEISNRGPGRYRGEAWSIVDVFAPDTARNTRFQVGAIGAMYSVPQRLNLRNGETRILRFQFQVPASVIDGTTVCATIAVGREPKPQFESQGDRFVFCSVKQAGAFEALPVKEGRRHYRELTDRGERQDRSRQ